MRKTAICLLTLGLSACATGPGPGPDAAKGFRGLFLHDECIGENAAQPDTCLHRRVHEKTFVFGGKPGTTYDVRLRVRGLFEPTKMQGGTAPDPAHPYFYSGGETATPDYSQWRIDVSSPARTYTLNNYPAVSHNLQGGLRGDDRGRCRRQGQRPGDRRQRPSDRQRSQRPARPPAGDRRRDRDAARRPDAQARRHAGHAALTAFTRPALSRRLCRPWRHSFSFGRPAASTSAPAPLCRCRPRAWSGLPPGRQGIADLI